MIAHGLPIYVALEPVDMRLGAERLGALVRERMRAEPRSRALFVLVGRRGQSMKVAEYVTGYEMVKLRPDTIDDRAPTIPASLLLTERFKSRIRDWSYFRADGTKANVMGGQVVSGEKLVNNWAFCSALIARFPDAIGGELESVGAYAVAARRRREILLVKSICDWANGLKNDRAQAFAAGTATSLVRHVLSKRDVLSSLGVPEYDTSSAGSLAVVASDHGLP